MHLRGVILWFLISRYMNNFHWLYFTLWRSTRGANKFIGKKSSNSNLECKNTKFIKNNKEILWINMKINWQKLTSRHIVNICDMCPKRWRVKCFIYRTVHSSGWHSILNNTFCWYIYMDVDSYIHIYKNR